MGRLPLIFLLEDDKDIQAFNMDLMIAAGYVPMCAGTLAEARMLLEEVQLRLYLLDGQLPDGSGLDLCRELREKGVTEPILILSADDAREDIQRGLAAGADRYMTRPYHSKELCREIAFPLGQKGAAEP